MLVLLVEDDHDLAASIMDYLALEGIDCDYAENGKIALMRLFAPEQHYDSVILDINLPYIDGMTLCKQLRQQAISTPCLMLTARDALADKLLGFQSGADDYLVKPFAMPELVMRLYALVRRYQQPPRLQIRDLVLDIAQQQAYRADKLLLLSHSEWILLLMLARKSPQPVSKEILEDALWPDGAPSKDAFKMVLYRLRQVVDAENAIQLIHTLRGVGVALHE